MIVQLRCLIQSWLIWICMIGFADVMMIVWSHPTEEQQQQQQQQQQTSGGGTTGTGIGGTLTNIPEGIFAAMDGEGDQKAGKKPGDEAKKTTWSSMVDALEGYSRLMTCGKGTRCWVVVVDDEGNGRWWCWVGILARHCEGCWWIVSKGRMLVG